MAFDPGKDSWKETDEEIARPAPAPVAKKKGGFFPAPIGTSHLVGPRAHAQVRDRSQFPNAKEVVRCITCRKDYANLESLKAAHPTLTELKKRGEQHVIAYYSDDLLEPAKYALAKETYDNRMKLLAAARAAGDGAEIESKKLAWGGYPVEPVKQIIGLMSDYVGGVDGEPEIELPGPTSSI